MNKCLYLAISIAQGAGVGAAFDQIPVGICIGTAIGVVLDGRRNNKKQ